jgi:hypothetical protein
MWPLIFKTAAGISSVLSLLAFLAALFAWLQSKKHERSIVGIVQGEGIIKPKEVVNILKTFNSEEARITALDKIVDYDQSRAKAALKKIKPNIDTAAHDLRIEIQI